MRLAGLLLITYFALCDSGAIQLDNNNIDGVIQNNDLVFINFYADWCRFSNMLSPIWDQTADKVAQQFPDKRVVIGKVDCDKESTLGSKYHITKYPTLKFIQNGVLAKKEYRGQRSVESFITFVSDHVKDPVNDLTGSALDDKKRHIIGYFPGKEGPEYDNFHKLASTLKEDCVFHVGPVGEGGRRVVFRPAKGDSSSIYMMIMIIIMTMMMMRMIMRMIRMRMIVKMMMVLTMVRMMMIMTMKRMRMRMRMTMMMTVMMSMTMMLTMLELTRPRRGTVRGSRSTPGLYWTTTSSTPGPWRGARPSSGRSPSRTPRS